MTTITPNSEALAYYTTLGPLTDLSARAALVRELPESLPDLCRVVQGLVVHPFLAHLYIPREETSSSCVKRKKIAGSDRKSLPVSN